MAEIRKFRKHDIPVEEEFASAYYLQGWRRGRPHLVEIPPRRGVNTSVQPPLPRIKSVQETFRDIASALCKHYPGISTEERVLGGVPHIRGTRLSVAHVLAHLHHLGSVNAVIDEFKQSITAEQVKEALAYSHDFMETICDAPEDDD